MAKYEEIKEGIIFPKGNKNKMFDYFIGQSYLNRLVEKEISDVSVSNVTFEPGCRNNWHKHNDGYQILLVTGGEGWYQEEGKEARLLKAGDIVVIADGVKHWHGATKDSWFAHIAINKGEMEWLEEVDDTYYEAR
ncbi:cupin domain-containing protein [Phocicoccus pinnipedialis]|uniref:cupin domain-containing protein n=1 Tax=Phocicoccus pinnipedialis TaxID=110845 RepID=UPI00163EE642|nr:cupin domain-containing protein [Jeotgalicoccus pinnipedialis]